MAKANDRTYFLLYTSLVILILLRLIPFLFPASRTWGFNHLIFLPAEYSYAFFAIAAIILILPLIRKSERLGIAITKWFSGVFFESRLKYLYRFFFAAGMTILFVIFASKTHYLGDGYGYLKILGSEDKILHRWSEMGGAELMLFLQSLFGARNEETALQAFRILSFISGFAVILLSFGISQVIGKSGSGKLLIFLFSLCSGSLLLFFGYVEYYPFVWVFMLGHLYFFLNYVKSDKGLLNGWLILAVGVFYHLEMSIFIPGALFATFSHGKGELFYRTHKKTIRLIIAATILCAVIISSYKIATNLYFQDIFLPLFYGKPIDPDYAVFSLVHLADILNELILVSPILLVMLLIAIKKAFNISKDKLALYFGILSASSILFLLFIDPKLAMPRDWDLFSITVFPITLLAWVLIRKGYTNTLKKLILPIILYMVISPLPFLITNLQSNSSIKYAEYMVTINPRKSFGLFHLLREYYRNAGNYAKYDSLQYIYNTTYTNIINRNRALNALMHNDYNEFNAVLPMIRKDKFDPDYHRIIGRFNYLRGNYSVALEHANKAVQLRKFFSDHYWDRAVIYEAMDEKEKALADLHEAYSINPASTVILTELSIIYAEMGNYDSSIFYGEKRFAIDSLSPNATYALAQSYANTGETEKAIALTRKYSEFVKNDSSFYPKLRSLVNLLRSKQKE